MKRSEISKGDVIRKKKRYTGEEWEVVEVQERQIKIYNKKMKRKILVENERLKYWELVKGGNENV